jgi:hypothetical protein
MLGIYLTKRYILLTAVIFAPAGRNSILIIDSRSDDTIMIIHCILITDAKVLSRRRCLKRLLFVGNGDASVWKLMFVLSLRPA